MRTSISPSGWMINADVAALEFSEQLRAFRQLHVPDFRRLLLL